MTFTAYELPPMKMAPAKPKKAEYPFASMAANPNTGFLIPAECNDLFAHCRVMASNYNKRHATNIRCNKQADGSLRVWNEPKEQQPIVTVVTPVPAAAAAGASEVPNKDQYIQYIETIAPGITIILNKEYAHRFVDFQTWTDELTDFETKIEFNPPSLRITRKAGN